MRILPQYMANVSIEAGGWIEFARITHRGSKLRIEIYDSLNITPSGMGDFNTSKGFDG